jgi:hypothetical protein
MTMTKIPDLVTDDEVPITAKQAGARWNLPPSWFYDRARSGEAPHFKLGRYVRFHPKRLAAWMATQHVDGKE